MRQRLNITNIGASPYLIISMETAIMTTQNNNTSLLNDKMVDMAFITRFTGLTWAAVPAGCKAKWKPGFSSVSVSLDSR